MKNFDLENENTRSLLPESGADAPTVLSSVYTDSTPAKNRQADVPQYGRSMIEMLGVLAIIGVLSVGGIAGYSKAMMKYRINKTIEQITLIAGNVRTFFANQKNYDGVFCSCNASGCTDVSRVDAQSNPTSTANGCPIHKKAKIFPDEMITVTDGKIMSITNPFGGGVLLDTAYKSQSSNYYQAFQIYYHDFPQEACIELATHDWSNAGASIININDAYISKTPADLDIATEYCSDGDDNEIFLYFDVDANSTFWTEQLGEQ